MAKKGKRKTVRVRKLRNYCYYCKDESEPTYKEYKTLAKFMSDRAKIIGNKRSGLCSRHQRRLSTAIKRARFLGLLPFAPKV